MIGAWGLSLCALVAVAAETGTMAEPISEALQPFVERGELAGAVVLVARGDEEPHLVAVGWASLADKRPMAADTVFWIASQSKAMSAAALMMLVDEGKVALDDPLAKYLPELGGLRYIAEQDGDHLLLKTPLAPVTLRQALSHMAGFRFASPLEQLTLDRWPLADAVRGYALTPLDHEPGTKYAYSNMGINAAARVIEVVSGQPYEQFMQERLFDPLGMRDTTFWPTAAQLTRLAAAYGPNGTNTGLDEIEIGQLAYPLSDHAKRYPVPAGGLFSTARDCLAFCRLLVGDGVYRGRRLLSAAAVAEMTSRQTPAAVPESYGLGLAVGDHWFGHGGALGTNMAVWSEQDVAYVYLVQHAGYPGEGAKAAEAAQAAATAWLATGAQ